MNAESTARICAALVKAQREFGPVIKDAVNPHFKNDYATLGAAIEAVTGALNRNGIALVQRCTSANGLVCVETVFAHESGETLSAGSLCLPPVKQDPQAYGSAITYARRYSLLAACGLSAEDDDGNATSAPAKPVRKDAGPSADERRWAEAESMLLVDSLATCDADAFKSIRGNIAALYKRAPWLDTDARKLINDAGAAARKRLGL